MYKSEDEYEIVLEFKNKYYYKLWHSFKNKMFDKKREQEKEALPQI